MRRYLRPRRQTPEAGTEEQPAAATLAQDLPQETQTPAETEQHDGSVIPVEFAAGEESALKSSP